MVSSFDKGSSGCTVASGSGSSSTARRPSWASRCAFGDDNTNNDNDNNYNDNDDNYNDNDNTNNNDDNNNNTDNKHDDTNNDNNNRTLRFSRDVKFVAQHDVRPQASRV